jgi:hypothetical protein
VCVCVYVCACVTLVIEHAKGAVACLTQHFFSTLSHKTHDILKNFLNVNRAVWFLYNFVRKISHSKWYSARHSKKCISVIKKGNQYSSHILMKLDFTRQIFKKFSTIKFHEDHSIWIGDIPKRLSRKAWPRQRLLFEFLTSRPRTYTHTHIDLNTGASVILFY